MQDRHCHQRNQTETNQMTALFFASTKKTHPDQWAVVGRYRGREHIVFVRVKFTDKVKWDETMAAKPRKNEFFLSAIHSEKSDYLLSTDPRQGVFFNKDKK